MGIIIDTISEFLKDTEFECCLGKPNRNNNIFNEIAVGNTSFIVVESKNAQVVLHNGLKCEHRFSMYDREVYQKILELLRECNRSKCDESCCHHSMSYMVLRQSIESIIQSGRSMQHAMEHTANSFLATTKNMKHIARLFNVPNSGRSDEDS